MDKAGSATKDKGKSTPSAPTDVEETVLRGDILKMMSATPTKMLPALLTAIRVWKAGGEIDQRGADMSEISPQGSGQSRHSLADVWFGHIDVDEGPKSFYLAQVTGSSILLDSSFTVNHTVDGATKIMCPFTIAPS